MSDQTFIVKEVRNSTHDGLGYSHLDLPSPSDELDELGNPKVFIYQNVCEVMLTIICFLLMLCF